MKYLVIPSRIWNRITPGNTMRRLLGFAFFGAAWLRPMTSFAQAGDPAAARTLFQEARKAANAGDYTTACPKFADSYQLDPAIGTLLNIADCEQRLGHIAKAWVTFQKALDQLSKNDDRRPAVEKAAAGLEKRLPRLSVRLAATAPKESTIERDGVQVGSSSLGMALPVDPGHHVVIVKASGHQEQRYEVDVSEGQSRELLCEPGAAVTPSASVSSIQPEKPALTSETEKPASAAGPISTSNAPPLATAQTQLQSEPRSRTVGYVVGGIGAAGLAVGVVTRVLAFGQKSSINAHCDVNKACDQTGMDAVSRANTFQTVSTVSLLVGLAGVGTGIYLVVAGSEKPSTQATLHPLVLPSGAGLSLQRNF